MEPEQVNINIVLNPCRNFWKLICLIFSRWINEVESLDF